jgi:hypothetical protein
MMEPQDWDEVRVEVDWFVAKPREPFDPGTLANAKELISICRGRCPLPTWVAKGYSSTVSLPWPKFEIEVFQDRLEIYHFNGDKKTDIWYEMHEPGGAFSEKFLDELPKLAVLPEPRMAGNGGKSREPACFPARGSGTRARPAIP